MSFRLTSLDSVFEKSMNPDWLSRNNFITCRLLGLISVGFLIRRLKVSLRLFYFTASSMILRVRFQNSCFSAEESSPKQYHEGIEPHHPPSFVFFGTIHSILVFRGCSNTPSWSYSSKAQFIAVPHCILTSAADKCEQQTWKNRLFMKTGNIIKVKDKFQNGLPYSNRTAKRRWKKEVKC